MDEFYRNHEILIWFLSPLLLFTFMLVFANWHERKEPLSIKTSISSSSEIRFDCTLWCQKEFRRLHMIRIWLPIGTFIVSGGASLLFILFHGGSVYTALKIAAVIGTISLVFVLFLVHTNAPEKKLSELAKGQQLMLQVDSVGIQVPALLLTDPARWRLADKQMLHTFIPWSDISEAVIAPRKNEAPAQIYLLVKGNSAEFGRGALGMTGMNGAGFGIKREPLKRIEAELIQLFRKNLENRFVSIDRTL